MRIHVKKFINYPSLFIYMLPPCTDDIDDFCLISCKNYNDIFNAVKTDDGRVYDAHCLKLWLSKHPDKNFVIPGVHFEYVYMYSWLDYYMSLRCLHKFQKFLNFITVNIVILLNITINITNLLYCTVKYANSNTNSKKKFEASTQTCNEEKSVYPYYADMGDFEDDPEMYDLIQNMNNVSLNSRFNF